MINPFQCTSIYQPLLWCINRLSRRCIFFFCRSTVFNDSERRCHRETYVSFNYVPREEEHWEENVDYHISSKSWWLFRTRFYRERYLEGIFRLSFFGSFKPSFALDARSTEKFKRLSFLRCFGPDRVLYSAYLYPPLVRTRRSIATDLQNLWKLFCLRLSLSLSLDLDFSATGSTRGRPSCVGDHDVSLASCLPGSTWHWHDRCSSTRFFFFLFLFARFLATVFAVTYANTRHFRKRAPVSLRDINSSLKV